VPLEGEAAHEIENCKKHITDRLLINSDISGSLLDHKNSLVWIFSNRFCFGGRCFLVNIWKMPKLWALFGTNRQ